MTRKTFFTIAMLSFSKILLAQFAITGKLTSGSKQEIAATIELYKDSILVQATINDSTGYYRFNNLHSGQYKLTLSAVGFIKNEIYLGLQKDTVINFRLAVDSKVLKEVKVTASKPLIERKIDRLVFNVENSIYSKGVSAIDVLRETPRIEISGDDGITMIGKSGVKVMIDGRILNLSEEDIKTRLKALRSEDIASIQVIPIPPAKYSAAGNSGLINIVLKKNPSLGWKGSVTGSYIQRNAPSTSESGTINFKSEKFEASLNLNNSVRKIINEKNDFYDLFTANKSLNSEAQLNATNRNTGLNSVIKYKLSSDMEIGALISYSNTSNLNRDIGTNTYKTGGVADSSVKSFSTYRGKRNSVDVSAYYDYNLDKLGKKMTLTYDSYWNTGNTDKNLNSIISTTPTEKDASLINNGEVKYKINSAMADFELPYSFAKIETGGAYTLIRNTSEIKLYENTTGEMVLDPSGTNDFNYSEKTAALYLSMEKQLDKKLEGKAGLRFEQTSIEGISPTLQTTNKRQYGKLFPSLYLLYKLNTKNTLSLAYSKRIQRPGFNDLNPFRYYSGIYSYTAGNAYLMPSFTDNVELNYIYKNNLSLILSASKSTDNSGYVTIFDDGTNIWMPENYYDETRVGFDVSYRFRPAKWWTISTSGNLNHNRSQTFLTDLQIPDVSGFASSARIGNTFTLNSKRTTFFALNYNQNFPSQNGLLKIESYGYLSANLRFSLINDNLSFMISTLDPFKQNIMVSEMKYNNYKSTSTFNSYMQNILITATYSFGNERVKNVNRQSKNTESQRAQ